MTTHHHYIIGDIHGCHRELLALEKKISTHAAKAGVAPFFVSVGDLVDRGPDTMRVVRHLREGVTAGTHAVVLGNHEQMLLEMLHEFAPGVLAAAGVNHRCFLRDFRQMHAATKTAARYLPVEDFLLMRRLVWIADGGGATLTSYGCLSSDPQQWRIPAEDLRFFAERPLLWEHDTVVVTHGLCDRDALAAIRAYQAGNGPAPSPAQVNAALWSRQLPTERLDPHKWHVSGHTAHKRARIKKKMACVQIDSACVFERRLSAWCAETEEVISVRNTGY